MSLSNKKQTKKTVAKLRLSKETIRELSANQVREVMGGGWQDSVGPGTGCPR